MNGAGKTLPELRAQILKSYLGLSTDPWLILLQNDYLGMKCVKDLVHSKYALMEMHFLQRYLVLFSSPPDSKKRWTDSPCCHFLHRISSLLRLTHLEQEVLSQGWGKGGRGLSLWALGAEDCKKPSQLSYVLWRRRRELCAPEEKEELAK